MPLSPGSLVLIFHPRQVGLEAAVLMLPWDAGALSLPFWARLHYPISPFIPSGLPLLLQTSCCPPTNSKLTAGPPTLPVQTTQTHNLCISSHPHKTQCLVLRLHFHPKYSSKLIRHEILYAKTGTFPMGKQQSQSSQAWQETLSFQEPRVMWDKLNDATQQVSQRNTARAMTRPTRLKISQCLPTLYILLHLMCHNYSFLCTHSCV